MYYRMKIIVAVFLLLSVASIKSDHIEDDCREIHCPKPELDCPADSELKSTATEDSEENDEDSHSNPFDRLAAEGLIEGFFPTLKLESTTHPPHVVEKRSLQHRRREAIKIVPGDYRSFEPEFFKYHNHHQPHRKWKRDLIMGVQPHSEAAIKKCCPEFQCVCKTCPAVPRCYGGKVAIVVDQGHGLPGSCCPRYECVPEIECTTTSQSMVSYWRDECKKCDCFGGQELCQQLCVLKEDDSANNCFSEYLNRPMMNGEIWLEDQDCKECKCVNGETQCEGSFCKPVVCANPVKVEGRCCKVCPVTTSTTTEGPAINTTIVDVTTSDVTVISTEAPTTRIITTTPVTTTTTITTPTTSSTTTTTTTTTTYTTSSITTTESDEFITEDDATTYLPPTVIISTPKEMGDLLKQIDVIVVLALATLVVIVCTLGIIYVVKQSKKQKKSMYSTIPSSESSQSSRVTLA